MPDDDLRAEIEARKRKLDEIFSAGVEPNTRLASATKEAALLNELTARSSSSAMMKAAGLVAEALDRNTVAANRSSRSHFWLGAAYVVATFGLLAAAWCRPGA